MQLNEGLIAELQHEAVSTRKMLERVPADKFGWKPHEKSMTLGRLASHIAEIPGWTNETINQDVLDFAKMEYKPFEPNSAEELVKFFDDKLASALDTLKNNATDENLMGMWTMKNGETVYMTMPRIAVMRGFVLSHLIHHRAQLGVYLRLLDVPVPSSYGPSADEGQM
ncbi:MAG: DinB family protein [Ignavibacteria bacterium]|nr:DinB family protein [Ignavibacteria bacterium]